VYEVTGYSMNKQVLRKIRDTTIHMKPDKNEALLFPSVNLTLPYRKFERIFKQTKFRYGLQLNGCQKLNSISHDVCKNVISTIILPRYFTCMCSFAAPCTLVFEVQSPVEDFGEPSGEPNYEEIGDNAISAVAAVTRYKKIDYAPAYAKKERKTITVIETTTYFQRRIEHDRLYRERLRRRLENRLESSIAHAKMGRHIHNTSVLVHKSSQQPYIAVRVQVIIHSSNGNTSELLRSKRTIKPITVEEQNANYFNMMMCPGLVIGFQRITGYLCHLNEQYSLGRKLLNSAFRKSVDRKLVNNK
ncbi:hypothetical protein CRM22_011408, partial [Opisthorchis felineus]